MTSQVKIFYTKHAEEKLKRPDIKNFGIERKVIINVLRNPRSKTRTRYGEFAAISELDSLHDLRVIYDIINSKVTKVITFHIARKGRYK